MKNAYEPSNEEIQALVDGELSPEAAARVRSAMICSPRAIAELDECLQMAALAHALREEAAAPKPTPIASGVIPLLPHPPRIRPSTIVALVASLAAAAAILLVPVRVDRPAVRGVRGAGPSEMFASALSPRRGIEPRLSWPAADRYRPYDTARASGGEHSAEKLSFELLAQVEKLGDPRAMTAAEVLVGNTNQTAHGVTPAHRSPGAESDRAAIALVEGRPEDALLAAAAALEMDPHHAQAAWNRALALERLGLPVTASEAFAAIASRGEPGWSREASERGHALRTQFERRQAAWKAANEEGARLVAGRPMDEPSAASGRTRRRMAEAASEPQRMPSESMDSMAPSAVGPRLGTGSMVDDATVAAYPGLMRRYLYDAVRSASSAERVRALRPLAQTLDAGLGGQHLTGYVDRIARASFRRRGPLAARYAALARGELTDQAEVQPLLDALRAAQQDDMLLGALVHVGARPWRPTKPLLAEYLVLARATGDPWIELEAQNNRAWIALWSEDFAFAQTILSSAALRCEVGRVDYLCADTFRLLTHAYVSLHRPDAARRTLDRAGEIARATGDVEQETDLLRYSQLVAAQRDDTSSSLIALSMAYLDEQSREDTDCAVEREAREWKAITLINQNRLVEARREMAGDTSPCDAPFTSGRAFVLAQLSENDDEAAVQALRREIAALRTARDASPGEQAFLDHVEGRLLVRRAPAEGQALLRRAMTAAAAVPGDIKADKARSYSYSVLVEDAVTRGATGEALALLAEERGVPAPESCALGASVEDAAVFVARAADGRVTGARVVRKPGEPAGAAPVPDAIAATLVGCPSVDVFARQPYYGRPDLLPREIVWQFRTGAPEREAARGWGAQVVVANIDPPAGLDLAPLHPVTEAHGAIMIEGATATPERVIAAAADASFLEVHAHGLLGGEESDTSLLVLAPDSHGRYALGGADIRRARLRGAPVVVLAACHASAIGGAFHSTWGLADAFAEAGARAVIASPDPIQDAGASAFFARLRLRITSGQPPAVALREERMARNHPSDRIWIDRLVVFR